jgi:small subunit ribosomal protein S1
MTENFAKLFEESLMQLDMKPGAIIKGRVIQVSSDFVVLNAGLKSEAAVPLEQFKDEAGKVEVKVGDIVDVALDSMANGMGETCLSREKAKRAEAWTFLEDASKSGKAVLGMVSGKVKGGFTVELGGIRAFLPGSLVDLRSGRDSNLQYEGKEFEFKVIKIDKKRNNVVVSRRLSVENESNPERLALLQQLEEGQEMKGVVKNLTDYGVFIDLGGIDGLLHITDMSWKRVKQPSELLSVGQEVQVKILKFDREKNRVSLGLKQFSTDPWGSIKERYPLQTRVNGVVTNITDYGCFVELEPGVEGLVHISEMDWTNKNVHPSKVVQMGQEVSVVVLEIDESRRRISLGIKQSVDNPWAAFDAKHQKGDRIVGKIKSITDFGVFVGLDGDIDGLIHLSDISWNTSGEEAIRQYKKGQEIEAVLLAVDAERERISLGIKQLEQDPFSDYVNVTAKGAVVIGKVLEANAKGIKVELVPGVEGFIRPSEFSRDEGATLKVGEEIASKYMTIDRKTRMLVLSIKAMETQVEAQAIKDFNRNKGSGAVTSSLGDLLKEKMNNQQRLSEADAEHEQE